MNDSKIAAQSDNYLRLKFKKKLKFYIYAFFLAFLIFAITFMKKNDRAPENRHVHQENQNSISRNIEHKRSHILKKGDTIYNVLAHYGLPPALATKLVQISKSKIDLSILKVGQSLQISYLINDGKKHFISLTLDVNNEQIVTIKSVGGNFMVLSKPIVYAKEINVASGDVTNSIFSSAIAHGVPVRNVMEAIKNFSYFVDFQRDVRADDKFKIIYEKIIRDDTGELVGGKTLYAELGLRNQSYKIYRFTTASGYEDFFDQNNTSVKRSLLKTPVQASRISSKFGMRNHPILGYSKMHKGIDFAAPAGTPIYASGHGVVVSIGYKSGYGKYLRLRHNSEIETAYAHVQRFSPQIKMGTRVKQGDIIAYVGSTGAATGPHLHYEVLWHSKQIDPLKFKLPAHVKLTGKDLQKFKEMQEYFDKL